MSKYVINKLTTVDVDVDVEVDIDDILDEVDSDMVFYIVKYLRKKDLLAYERLIDKIKELEKSGL